MATSTAKRQKNHTILANNKKDQSPKWDDVDSLTAYEFTKKFRESLNWYNLNKTGKELKPQVINWMAREGFEKSYIAQYKKTKDGLTGITMGAIAACLMKGMPPTFPGFNNNRNSADWLKNEIQTIVSKGEFNEEVESKPIVKSVIPVYTIQDRIREQAGGMCKEIDEAIDQFITDPDTFDPKTHNMVKLLRGKGVKMAHARFIKGFYTFGYNELMELASGNADDQLREAYKHLPRRNVKKLIEFYQSIMDACDQVSAESKINKKPRVKKAKPAEEQVKKLKFKTSDDKLGIVSIPPAQIIKAQSIIVYNTKTRKLGVYISKNSEGLSVKGTSLLNYTDKSIQKTLRKPLEQLRDFKDQNTQKRVETWIDKIKTTETKLNGRLNEDTIILKIFK